MFKMFEARTAARALMGAAEDHKKDAKKDTMVLFVGHVLMVLHLLDLSNVANVYLLSL